MDYTISLTEAELNKIVNLLADQPYRETATLIAKISGQVQLMSKDSTTTSPVEN